eukprot:scaffold36027_cov35-Prasinocladus_malaysianus.AAC.1
MNQTAADKRQQYLYCPHPGCNRKFRKFWRLRAHYRALPELRGSGKERGHGQELLECPKCGASLEHAHIIMHKIPAPPVRIVVTMSSSSAYVDYGGEDEQEWRAAVLVDEPLKMESKVAAAGAGASATRRPVRRKLDISCSCFSSPNCTYLLGFEDANFPTASEKPEGFRSAGLCRSEGAAADDIAHTASSHHQQQQLLTGLNEPRRQHPCITSRSPGDGLKPSAANAKVYDDDNDYNQTLPHDKTLCRTNDDKAELQQPFQLMSKKGTPHAAQRGASAAMHYVSPYNISVLGSTPQKGLIRRPKEGPANERHGFHMHPSPQIWNQGMLLPPRCVIGIQKMANIDRPAKLLSTSMRWQRNL